MNAQGPDAIDLIEGLESENRKLRDVNAELLRACRAVVREWEQSFEGQDTGYEDTPFEAFVNQCRAAIAKAEAKP